MRVRYGKIYIPHLNYTLTVAPFHRAPPSIPRALAYVERTSGNTATMYVPLDGTPSAVAHEVIHVLAYICDHYGMVFEREFEHMAYLMQYMLGKILGYEWSDVPERKRR